MSQFSIWQYYWKLQEGYKPTIKATTKRNHYFELGLDIKPFQSYDFYELEFLDVI
jgi:hypothetical protein